MHKHVRRSLITMSVVVAAAVTTPIAVATPDASSHATASAWPAFRMPFECGQGWLGSTGRDTARTLDRLEPLRRQRQPGRLRPPRVCQRRRQGPGLVLFDGHRLRQHHRDRSRKRLADALRAPEGP